ncbi:MAG: hypothetical protein KC443_01850, partial [Anaerolineales bacterium]|nr:hypothetical protein [Anaerolineales bacterium]
MFTKPFLILASCFVLVILSACTSTQSLVVDNDQPLVVEPTMDTLAPPTTTAESTTTPIPTNTPLPASTIVVTEPATDLSPMEESILPMPLYFGTDTTISRLETDGTTLSPLVTATDLTHWQLAMAGTVLYYQAGEKIMRLDTTSLTTSEIANDATPLNKFDLSPDDEALVYVNRENKLILTDVSGQNKTVLAEGELPP